MVMSLLEEGFKFIHRYSGAVAHSVERPSKFPVWCNSSDVDSMHVRDLSSPSDHAAVLGGRVKTVDKKIHPSHAICEQIVDESAGFRKKSLFIGMTE